MILWPIHFIEKVADQPYTTLQNMNEFSEMLTLAILTLWMYNLSNGPLLLNHEDEMLYKIG